MFKKVNIQSKRIVPTKNTLLITTFNFRVVKSKLNEKKILFRGDFNALSDTLKAILTILHSNKED